MLLFKTCAILTVVGFGAAATATATATADDPTCLDEGGAPVDWFAGYKLPRESAIYPRKDSPRAPLVDDGLAFASMSSSSPGGGWKLSGLSVGDPLSAPGRTLAPIYLETRRKDLAYVVYNDEHPDGNTSFTAGHTKGVVVFGEKTGFWLIHSVPKYPTPTESGAYGYPHTGKMYGQSFLCLTLDTKASAEMVGGQLMVNRPYVFESHVPRAIATAAPSLALAAAGRHADRPPYYSIRTGHLLGGRQAFVSYAKSTKFGRDLYADLVAPHFRDGFAVESWPNGPGKMNSSCSHPPAVVENVDSVRLEGFFYPPVSFTTRHDHSKWAVSLDGDFPVVCVGDINRMETQRKRAGGTACMHHRRLWKTFSTVVASVEACPRDRNRD